MNLFDADYRERHQVKKPWLSWVQYGFPFYYEQLVKDGNYKTPKFSFKIPEGLDLDHYYTDSNLWTSVAKHALDRSQITGEQLEEILEAAYFVVKQLQGEKTKLTKEETGDNLLQQIFDEQGDRITEMLLSGVRFARIAEAVNIPKGTLKNLIESDRVQDLLSEKKEELKLLISLLGLSISYEYYRTLNKSLGSLSEDSEAFATTLRTASIEYQNIKGGSNATTKDTVARAAEVETLSSDELIERFQNYAFGLSEDV